MKKVLSILAMTLLFFSCGQAVKHNDNVENSSEYDNVEELRGKTFSKYSSEYDILLKESLYFSPTGSVHFIEKVEGSYTKTRYDNFHYKLRGDTIEIYYDDNYKWNEEIRNTVFYEGIFHDTYMMICNVHLENNYERYTLEEINNEKNIDLSFMGFQLGSSFSKSVVESKKNKDIKAKYSDSWRKDGYIFYDSQLLGREMFFYVSSFQDTIKSINISASNQNTNSFIDLYIEKYGIPDDYKTITYTDNTKHLISIWNFSNGSISLSIVYDLGYPNSYAKRIEVVYEDFKHIKKEEDFKQAESMRLDSLNRIKEAEYYKKSREKI